MTAWILLRGLTRESRHWGDFPALLGKAIPAAEIVSLDLPGNGRANGVPSPTSIPAMAEHCRRALAAGAIPPPYHLLAMSLGAMVSVAWAASHPEELAGCVLINTSLRPFSPFYRRLRPRSYGTLLGLALPGRGVRRREEAIFDLTSTLAGRRERIVDDWVAWRREHPVSCANAWRQFWAASRYRAPAGRPAVPLLILAGGGDALVDPDCSRRLARAWRTDFAEHPGAGHDLPLDDGAWVAGQVRQWLGRKPVTP